MTDPVPSSGDLPSDEDMKDLQRQLENRMFQTGEYQKIQNELKARLNEVGWTDQVRSHAKEKARSQQELDFPSLQDDVAAFALDSLPEAIKTQVLGTIRSYIDSQLSENGN